jgi:hypothetical protein
MYPHPAQQFKKKDRFILAYDFSLRLLGPVVSGPVARLKHHSRDCIVEEAAHFGATKKQRERGGVEVSVSFKGMSPVTCLLSTSPHLPIM